MYRRHPRFYCKVCCNLLRGRREDDPTMMCARLCGDCSFCRRLGGTASRQHVCQKWKKKKKEQNVGDQQPYNNNNNMVCTIIVLREKYNERDETSVSHGWSHWWVGGRRSGCAVARQGVASASKRWSTGDCGWGRVRGKRDGPRERDG